ncbi:MAG: hypothetical protein ACD_58C00123G0008 [uncultured bacterium]|nr:MAG: hypothetical protein ACD_58C00123G0008 [uncultured bacterium]
MQNRVLSSEINKLVGKTVTMCGWVHSRRDHGKLVFIDLRDRKGLTQVVFIPCSNAHKLAHELRTEYVLKIEGVINKRPEKMINNKIISGKVELEAKEMVILNTSDTPPFEINKDTVNVDEETRLKYRYLDLRTERMANNIRMRHKVIQFIREYLTNKEDFIEIQTPILSKSTPEGARDYLVPSRMHAGKFFALPQSPQQYKQLLMVAGFEKYFQIAPCFRDEDARGDRSPGEFYQLDLEMSFVEQNDILELIEKLYTSLVKTLFPNHKITTSPWPRLKYDDAMKKYNCDKPDLRKDKNDKKELAFCWIIDFPLFQKQTKDDFFHGAGNKMAPSHHMFTAPKKEDVKLLDTDPLKARSYQHDLVLNGVEIGGGSIRIHDPKIQEKVFDLIGFTPKQKAQFAHLLKAFEFGVPPHGGIAPGLDRFIRLLQGEDAIKEIIAFPLTGDVRDPLMDSPTEVSQKQLDEVHIEVKFKKTK